MKSALKPGIYSICHLASRSLYVGSASKTIRIRWNQHKSELRRNKHGNTHLQNAWNKYGEDAFEFFVIENCPLDILVKREQYWFDEYNGSYTMYNVGTTITFPDHTLLSITKHWILIDPTGKQLDIYNLTEYARNNNLDVSALRKVAIGKTRSYKGYTSILFVEPPSRKRQVSIQCKQCETVFSVQQSQVSYRRFCSLPCRNLWDKVHGHFATNNPKPKQQVIKQCIICGSDSSIKRSAADRRKTCSKSCYAIWLKDNGSLADSNPNPYLGNNITKQCSICNRSFTVKLSVHLKGNGRFCSRKCKSLSQTKELRYPQNDLSMQD